MNRMCALAAAAMLFHSAVPAHSQDRESTESAVRAIRAATVSQRDGSHLPMLLSLRQLGDPSLAPLFRKLVHSREWQVQVHAVLGLAEIDQNRHIDPWLVKQIDPRGQEAVIASAIDVKLLKPEHARELLAWDNLEPMARLLLLGEEVSRDPSKADRITLLRLAEHPDLKAAIFATCLLAETGDKAAFSTLKQRLGPLSPRDRDQHLQYAFEIIRRYELKNAADWIAESLNLDQLSEETEYRGVFALLSCAPTRALPLWQAYASRYDRYAWRLRYAMILLASYDKLPPTAFDKITGDESTLKAIRTVGKALASNQDASAALIALLDEGNSMATEWVMTELVQLDTAVSGPVYEHLVRRLAISESASADRVQLGVRATAALYKTVPDAVRRLLSEAADDSVMQQAILLGLFGSNDHAIGQIAQSVKRIGAGRADSIALLLIARSDGELEKADLKQLGRIASGGGRVSDVLRVQGAWLYLRRTGGIDKALDEIFK